MPFRRIKAGVLKLGGMKIEHARFYEVLSGMKKEKFAKDTENVRKLARKLQSKAISTEGSIFCIKILNLTIIDTRTILFI